MYLFLRHLRSSQGFTLVEAMVAITVFLVVIGISLSVFTDSIATNRKIEVSRLLYEESRIALDRIAKEVRRGTIDYEEYWNRHHKNRGSTLADLYGKNYGDYALQFFRDADNSSFPPSSIADLTRVDENVGINYSSPALGDASTLEVCNAASVPIVPDNSGYEQCELYLITADGGEKTVIKAISELISGGSKEYRLGMLKMAGVDIDGNAIIDIWNPLSDFVGYAFQKIQPSSIRITGLKFFVSPLDDPRKAFAQFQDSVQIQPKVTILLTAEPSQTHLAGVKGKVPSITIQTTITARAQSEVKSLK